MILLLGVFWSCGSKQLPIEKPIKIVFVTGDEEYRSGESMPMLARLAKRELGAEVEVCYSLDSLGNIDPNNTKSISGLEALEEADLMVMFTRFRELPDDQLKMIKDYVESGRPIVGFRTSTHAFLYKSDSIKFAMNADWPTKVFGQQWITHHGHFEDGNAPLTSVTVAEKVVSPILNGVTPFQAYSWLYHVDGGDWKLYGNSKVLLKGKSLRSNHEMNRRLEEFPLSNPVAWTKSYETINQKKSKVFFTTLGHPYDFKIESMRKLAMNGIYWALDEDVPSNGVNVVLDYDYDPNNSGFGEKFKKGLNPHKI